MRCSRALSLTALAMALWLRPVFADQFRFDTIRAGQQEWSVLMGYGGNHRVPDDIETTFSFNLVKARYGWFSSRRDAYEVEVAGFLTDGGMDNDIVTATFGYRRYLLKRASTALCFDVAMGGAWVDGKFTLLGSTVNFTENIGLSFAHGLSPSSALLLEYRFVHISNAGMAHPNLGVNASTISLGMAWYP
jgi:lipid A 3-O-deacylase